MYPVCFCQAASPWKMHLRFQLMWEKKIIFYNVYFDGVEKTGSATGNTVFEILFFWYEEGTEEWCPHTGDSSLCTAPAFFRSSDLVPFLLLGLYSRPRTVRNRNWEWDCESSHYHAFLFHVGCITHQGTHWILIRASSIGNISCLPGNSKSSGFGAGLHVDFLLPRMSLWGVGVHLRVSRCCHAHVGVASTQMTLNMLNSILIKRILSRFG